MAKLARVLGKVFAGSAPLDEIGQFGSALAGNPTNTQDVATIQSLPAYSEGWGKGVISSRNYPPIEEVNGVLKTISYQTCYLLQEGIPEYDSNTEYSNTSIVKSISGTRLNFYVSLQNNNIGHPLSDTTYWAQATLNTGRNVGEIITSTIPLNDSGVHLLDGSVLSGSGIYSDFVSYISNIYNSALNYFCTETEWQTSVNTYGVCGKFVYDGTNNTVRLPKITGFIEGSIDVNTLGNLTPAGLPNHTHTRGSMNITGTVRGTSLIESMTATGVFYNAGNNSNQPPAEGKGTCQTIGFDASRKWTGSTSEAEYGDNSIENSSTVQPQSIKVLYYIVVANTQKTEIQVDIDNIATELNGKADVSLSNVNSTGSSTGAGWAMPSDRYVALTLGASGSTYTAPANGYFCLNKTKTSQNQYIAINRKSKDSDSKDSDAFEMGVWSNGNPAATEGLVYTYLPAKKDDLIQIDYSAGGAVSYFKFIYAQGSESEA